MLAYVCRDHCTPEGARIRAVYSVRMACPQVTLCYWAENGKDLQLTTTLPGQTEDCILFQPLTLFKQLLYTCKNHSPKKKNMDPATQKNS
jgi:hypothetical protein